MMQSSDHSEVLAHLNSNFYLDEPLCKLAGHDADMAEDIDNYVTEILTKSNLNFIVIDTATNKIAGVRICEVIEKSTPPETYTPSMFKSVKSWHMLQVGMALTSSAKIFSTYPKITSYVEFILVSVDKSFRGMGLATEIYERAVKMLTALNFPLIKYIFSSPYTERIARKNGWKELCKLHYINCKDEETDELHFPNAEPNQRAILMVKEL